MNRHLRPSIWFSIILVAAFIVGYLAWARANQAWPYDNEIMPYPKHESSTSSPPSDSSLRQAQDKQND